MGFNRLFNTRRFWSSIRTLLTRQLFTKLMSLVIIVSMLATTTPAAPSVMIASASEFGQDVRYAFLTSPTLASLAEIDVTNNFVFAFFFGGRNQQRIARIEVSPNRPTIREGERIVFAALALDERGNIIQGVQFNWTAVDTEKKSPVVNLKIGEFEAQFADSFVVTAEVNGMIGQTIVTVTKDTAFLAAKELTKIRTDEANGVRNERVLRQDVAEELRKPTAPPINVSTRDQLDEKTIRDRQEKIRTESATPITNPTNDEELSNNQIETESNNNPVFVKTKASPGPSAPEAEELSENKAKDEGNSSNNSASSPVMQGGGLFGEQL